MIMSIFDTSDWIPLLTGAGLGSAIAIVLLMQLIKERTLDRERIGALERFQQTTLIELIRKDAAAQEKAIIIMNENINAIKLNSEVTHKFLVAFDLHQHTLREITSKLK